MKEFVDKLIGRLEELKDDVVDDKCPVEKNSLECEKEYACETCYLTKAIKIVNELAEEYINTSTTNAQIIRSMTDEELAEITLDYDAEYGRYWCSDGTIFEDYEYKEALKREIEWLQSEVEGVTENE